MNKMVSKLVVALMLGAFVATSGMVSPIVLAAEQTNTQQNEQQVPPPADGNNQSNEHSGHH
ncbi:hypothetical protein M7775_13425 [Sporomusa sphaeroides DSM 2875]|uniref:hypothetical protein n=1 Tax=Sporomusa sphaeroides TaxID=47679 RepID=UPI00202EF2C5|nr:hypothetical protein [Sporomusa sphaeroides]MCM0759553.1 hypothetical protein [Sporomusa sphaeroides DSM 2875]